MLKSIRILIHHISDFGGGLRLEVSARGGGGGFPIIRISKKKLLIDEKNFKVIQRSLPRAHSFSVIFHSNFNLKKAGDMVTSVLWQFVSMQQS